MVRQKWTQLVADLLRDLLFLDPETTTLEQVLHPSHPIIFACETCLDDAADKSDWEADALVEAAELLPWTTLVSPGVYF